MINHSGIDILYLDSSDASSLLVVVKQSFIWVGFVLF